MDISVVSLFGYYAAVNIHIQVFVWTFVFTSLGYVPRIEIAETFDNSIFNVVRSCQTIFQSGCTILHSHQQSLRIPISLHPHQHLLLSGFLITVFLVMYSDISLWFWFAFPWCLMIWSIFSCTCWPFVYIWGKVYSDPIFNWVICLFIIELWEFFKSLDIGPLSGMWSANISFYGLSFHFLYGILWSKKVLNLEEVQFICFFGGKGVTVLLALYLRFYLT